MHDPEGSANVIALSCLTKAGYGIEFTTHQTADGQRGSFTVTDLITQKNTRRSQKGRSSTFLEERGLYIFKLMEVRQERSKLQRDLAAYEARINAREYISEERAMREWEDHVISSGGVQVDPGDEEPLTLQSLELHCASIKSEIDELDKNLFNVSSPNTFDGSAARRGGGSSTTGT
jgi:hypothetical protein